MNNTLDYYIKFFLTEYLPSYTTISPNTIKSYRDTFKLFINYEMIYKHSKSINIESYNYDNVVGFISWLSEERKCSEKTCNQRLACLKSFSKLLIIKEPTLLYECQKILEIKFKKYQEKEMQYLTIEQVKDIINCINININNTNEFKEKVILALLYYSGSRVSELINLKVENINFNNNSIKIIGKGNKIRIVPLMNEMIELLKKYLNTKNLNKDDFLFKSNQQKPYTSNGIRYIISKYTSHIPFKVTPHTFRHSIASHLLEANTSLIYIRDFLGHEHLSTTEHYSKVNLNIKKEILSKNMPHFENLEECKWENDNKLLEWLNNL